MGKIPPTAKHGKYTKSLQEMFEDQQSAYKIDMISTTNSSEHNQEGQPSEKHRGGSRASQKRRKQKIKQQQQQQEQQELQQEIKKKKQTLQSNNDEDNRLKAMSRIKKEGNESSTDQEAAEILVLNQETKYEKKTKRKYQEERETKLYDEIFMKKGQQNDDQVVSNNSEIQNEKKLSSSKRQKTDNFKRANGHSNCNNSYSSINKPDSSEFTDDNMILLKASDLFQHKNKNLTSSERSKLVFQWLLGDKVNLNEFYKFVWEKKPLYLDRQNKLNHQENLEKWIFSWKDFINIIESQRLSIIDDISISRYNLKNETTFSISHQCNKTGKDYLSAEDIKSFLGMKELSESKKKEKVEKNIEISCVHLLCPQKYNDKLWRFVSFLEESFGGLIEARITLLPHDISSDESISASGPQALNGHAFVIQLLGSSMWEVWAPQSRRDKLPLSEPDPVSYSDLKNQDRNEYKSSYNREDNIDDSDTEDTDSSDEEYEEDENILNKAEVEQNQGVRRPQRKKMIDKQILLSNDVLYYPPGYIAFAQSTRYSGYKDERSSSNNNKAHHSNGSYEYSLYLTLEIRRSTYANLLDIIVPEALGEIIDTVPTFRAGLPVDISAFMGCLHSEVEETFKGDDRETKEEKKSDNDTDEEDSMVEEENFDENLHADGNERFANGKSHMLTKLEKRNESENLKIFP